ncbi:hypothetical protein [Halomonas hibernica]|uniref:hypothetical protein n=1 Tax=Halomonas hibernica TaxID=2591147 RepID=UPI001554F7EE|nr:hypothetical protein [Halomonas hibernica]
MHWTKRVMFRLPGLARSVGVSMIAAALIAFALRPDTFTFTGAILLVMAGLAFWVLGAASEVMKEEEAQ